MSDKQIRLLGAKRLGELLQEHDVHLARSLGQNFVIDPNTIRKVVRYAELAPDDHVLEIGAGAGALTLGLLQEGVTVTAIEIDERLRPVLTEVLSGLQGVEVVFGDARKLDLSSIDATKVVANLPYNAAAEVIIRLLEEASAIETITAMTQREVGERLAAGPGSKIYGVTSLLAGFFSRISIMGSVSRRAFWPEPNVDSVIVRLDRVTPPAVDAALFKSVVKSAFAQRRKMLRNTIAGVVGGPESAVRALEEAGLSAAARAEDVDLSGFVALAESVGRTRE